jgi:transcription elongation GreA/GreB family factor
MTLNDPLNDPGTDSVHGTPDRTALMEQHVQARARRDQAELGNDAYRAAAEEIARIEVAIAALEEPAPTTGPGSPPTT